MFTTIIIFLIVLSVLVFAHEMGHFFTARRYGVKAEEFGFGFPPRAIGFYKNKDGKWLRLVGNKNIEELTDDKAPVDTVYSLNWLPMGGFVKIKGENGNDREDGDSFGAQKIWKRVVILSAGVVMNVILAFVLFSVIFMIGAPQTVTEGGRIQITEIVKDSPAEQAGLITSDVIVGADGIFFKNISEAQAYIGARAGQDIALGIIRNDEPLTITLQPAVSGDKAVIGVGLDHVDNVSYSFFRAIWEGFKHTFLILWFIIVAFFGLIRDLLFGHGAGDAVGGPIKIAQLTGEAARYGFANLLNFTALLSLNLAVINFLPFPALDGGRVWFLLVEKIRGKAINRDTEAIIHNIGFLILIGLIILVTYKDIARMF
jgi:regulator of sigma E protease